MRALGALGLMVLALQAVACSTEENPGTTTGGTTGDPPDTGCEADADCAASQDTPLCDVPTGECVALPPGHQIGYRDGSWQSVKWTIVHESEKPREPTDLAFNPAKPTELWVVNRKDDSVFIIQNPGETSMEAVRLRDPAATHFMDKPPAIAFGAMTEEWGQTWATCGDNNNGGDNFMGPALFSADPEIFAKPTPDGLGSHLDMLHSTTFCRGIAHVEGNIYWAFNSNKQSLDLYDFKLDHGPGADDHSDGEILRYVSGQVLGVDNVPSHLVYDAAEKMLYVADTGNKRIAKLDVMSGTPGKNFGGLEPTEVRKSMDDAALMDVVPPGILEAPSGIELHDGLIFVSDSTTSHFYAFDRSGKLVRELDSGFPPGSLAGFTFGPDGKLYMVNMLDSRVYRIDPM